MKERVTDERGSVKGKRDRKNGTGKKQHRKGQHDRKAR
jgi:hypothetical protein